jgi:hypothetical protein
MSVRAWVVSTGRKARSDFAAPEAIVVLFPQRGRAPEDQAKKTVQAGPDHRRRRRFAAGRGRSRAGDDSWLLDTRSGGQPEPLGRLGAGQSALARHRDACRWPAEHPPPATPQPRQAVTEPDPDADVNRDTNNDANRYADADPDRFARTRLR